MFNKKIKQEIEFLKLQVESQGKTIQQNWKYIQALMDAEKQNRKDLNAVIAKINQMKEKENKKCAANINTNQNGTTNMQNTGIVTDVKNTENLNG